MLGSSGKESANKNWISKTHAVFYKKLFPTISQNSNDKHKIFKIKYQLINSPWCNTTYITKYKRFSWSFSRYYFIVNAKFTMTILNISIVKLTLIMK